MKKFVLISGAIILFATIVGLMILGAVALFGIDIKVFNIYCYVFFGLNLLYVLGFQIAERIISYENKEMDLADLRKECGIVDSEEIL